jgi:hypothetical protein
MRASCPRCSGGVEQKSLGIISVVVSPLRLTVEDMPAAGCAKNHSAPIDNEFMPWLAQELKGRGAALPAAEESRRLSKRFLCACGKDLAPHSERKQTFPLELAYAGYPSFTAAIEMPVYKCSGCGKPQLRSVKEAQKFTSLALGELSDAAGFPHAA